jgi:hypothetical protein
MKNYLKIAFIGLLVSLVFFACSKNDDQIKNDKVISNSVSRSALSSNNALVVGTFCDITGATVVSSGSAIVNAGSSTTYNYFNDTGTSSNIVWSVKSANPVGSIVIVSNGASASVTYASNFVSGSITAYGTGGVADPCRATLTITKTPNIPDCSCPQPYFECVTANIGSPYWRIYVRGLQSNDAITITTSNATLRSGISSYVILEPLGSVNSNFILYCEVKRTCPNGSIKKRKIYYQNYYGGNEFGGTTGVVNLGNICDSSPSPLQ